MISSNTLFKDTLKLVKSMVFKLHHNAVAINHEMEISYGKNIANFQHDDQSTWRHFMNMSGQYHSFDNFLLSDVNPNGSDKILIVAKEDGLEHELTEAFLQTHPVSRENLNLDSKYYNILLDKYPSHETLIRGIIYPIDMDIILNAKDGVILDYDKSLIESQEYTLIHDLELAVDRYLQRWNVVDYTLVDNLYVSTLLANITSLSILHVINHRLSKTGTYEVHSFHMHEFFKSNFALGDYVDVLSPYSKMWLYKNLKYIIKNIGRNETLTMLIDNLFVNSGLTVNEIILRNKDVEYNDQATLLEPSFTCKNRNLFKIKHGTSSDNVDKVRNKDMLVNEVFSVDNDVRDILRDVDLFVDKSIEHLKKIYSTTERTKIINLDAGLIINLNAINFKEVILENWLNFINDNTIYADMTLKTLLNEDTGMLYKVSARQASIIALKCILYLDGSVDKPFNEFTLNTVIKSDIDKNTLYDGLYIDDSVKDNVNNLIDRFPIPGGIADIEITTYLSSIVNWYLNYWTIVSNTTVKNAFALKIVLDRLRVPERITIHPTSETVDRMLLDDEIVVNIDSKKYANELLNVMIKTFLGINIDKYEELRDTVSKYKIMLDRLTSYSVHVIADEVKESYIIPNTRVNILNGLNIISIEDSLLRCLEAIYSTLDAEYDYGRYLIDTWNLNKMQFRVVDDPIIEASIIGGNGIMELPTKMTINIKD